MRTTSRRSSAFVPGSSGPASTPAPIARAMSTAPVARRALLPEPFCTGGRERWARTTSQPTSTMANPTPWTSFAADSEVPSAIEPESSTSGAAAVSGTLLQRRATPRVTAPPSSPASHGSASTGPRASTGGSRVSHRFQPRTAQVARSLKVCPVGSTPPTRSVRTASGPPSRK